MTKSRLFGFGVKMLGPINFTITKYYTNGFPCATADDNNKWSVSKGFVGVYKTEDYF